MVHVRNFFFGGGGGETVSLGVGVRSILKRESLQG